MKLKFTVLVVAALAILAAAVPTALAGTYTVNQCGRGGGDLGSWQVAKSGSWTTKNDCPSSYRLSAQGAGLGRWVSLRTPALPAQIGVQRVSFVAQGLRAKDARPEARFCKTSAGTCKGLQTRRVAKSGKKVHGAEYVWHSTPSAPSARGFELRVYADGGRKVSSTSFLSVNNVKLTMFDGTAPAVQASPHFDAAAWQRGRVSFQVAATDPGAGVASFALEVDGHGVDQVDKLGSCEFSKFAPCASQASADLSVATGNLSDGNHIATITVTDAAGNATSSKVAFKSDNTAPPTPGPIFYTGGGCYAASYSWPYPTTSDAGSAFVAVRFTYALWEFGYTDQPFAAMSPPVSVTLPLGTDPLFGDVTLASIANVQMDEPSSNSNYYVTNIQILDEAGNASDVSSTYVNADGCPG